ncbi:MAG: zinc ribbon domain-containing protein [Candidatus Alcyoniella australis]|nr:zinc ribbon domain-containing protein [Candidatus Alcyoniella australis]
MPIYEYECRRCGATTSFIEKMFQRPRLFGSRRRCSKCGSKKLVKVVSSFSSKVERTRTETLNEMAGMGNVQFVPQQSQPQGPPPGGCPYCSPEGQEKENDKPKGPDSINVRTD